MGEKPNPTDEKLKKLLQEHARLQSKIAHRKKVVSRQRRDADSKRKIILGGVLIAAIRKGGIRENAVRILIDRYASDRDKKVFEDFQFEKPEAGSAAAESAVAESVPDRYADGARE